jgi:hypothetical protein
MFLAKLRNQRHNPFARRGSEPVISTPSPTDVHENGGAVLMSNGNASAMHLSHGNASAMHVSSGNASSMHVNNGNASKPKLGGSVLDLSLGQELAGGGSGGKQAKMGKLIIEPEGLKMLDLIVAANLGLWWRAYEKS